MAHKQTTRKISSKKGKNISKERVYQFTESQLANIISETIRTKTEKIFDSLTRDVLNAIFKVAILIPEKPEAGTLGTIANEELHSELKTIPEPSKDPSKMLVNDLKTFVKKHNISLPNKGSGLKGSFLKKDYVAVVIKAKAIKESPVKKPPVKKPPVKKPPVKKPPVKKPPVKKSPVKKSLVKKPPVKKPPVKKPPAKKPTAQFSFFEDGLVVFDGSLRDPHKLLEWLEKPENAEAKDLSIMASNKGWYVNPSKISDVIQFLHARGYKIII